MGRSPPPHSGNARKKTFFFFIDVFPNAYNDFIGITIHHLLLLPFLLGLCHWPRYFLIGLGMKIIFDLMTICKNSHIFSHIFHIFHILSIIFFTYFTYLIISIIFSLQSTAAVFSMFSELGMIQRWRIDKHSLGRFLLMVIIFFY